jgi:pimeloyl-ACP methyl ester carboxylesterase
MDASPHKSDFVNLNGIKLHYLDWGGKGETLLFLTGLGLSAHIYDRFAPRFTDSFRVLALTRRAHGDSDYPETGYDINTLVEDIRQFLDELDVQKLILAGHSLAGVELTHFAGMYPERVIKLVYLDALDDRRELPTIMEQNPLKGLEPPKAAEGPFTLEEYIANLKANRPDLADIWSELWDIEVSHSIKKTTDGKIVDRMSENVEKLFKDSLLGYVPVEMKVRIPILSFHALGEARLPDYLTDEQKQLSDQFNKDVRLPFRKRLIREFQNRFPHAKIVEIPDGHHYCFIAQEELVYDEMKKFLLE